MVCNPVLTLRSARPGGGKRKSTGGRTDAKQVSRRQSRISTMRFRFECCAFAQLSNLLIVLAAGPSMGLKAQPGRQLAFLSVFGHYTVY
jgi:hypothetical protein